MNKEKFDIVRQYRKKELDKKLKHRNKMFCNHNLEITEKSCACYQLAWEYGHSAGLYEVEQYFNELVDLIK